MKLLFQQHFEIMQLIILFHLLNSMLGKRISATKMNSEIRFGKIGHTINVSKTQLRCIRCPGKTARKCEKCNIGEHDECF